MNLRSLARDVMRRRPAPGCLDVRQERDGYALRLTDTLDEETERFIAAIIADRRPAAEVASSE